LKRVALYVAVFVVFFGLCWGYGQVWKRRGEREEQIVNAQAIPPVTPDVQGTADWIVYRAGDASYNGEYSEAGVYNGKTYYTHGTGEALRYLYWGTDVWALSDELDPVGEAYNGDPETADLPANDWMVGVGEEPTNPATPILTITPEAERRREAAARARGKWTVSGAGDTSYNGVYSEAGTHNGQPYYTYGTGEATRYLCWDSDGSVWSLADELGSAFGAYGGDSGEANLPANPWEQGAGSGTLPAPTVAAPLEVQGRGEWTVSGAGEDCNGDYSAAGTYNGKAYYVRDAGGWYLIWTDSSVALGTYVWTLHSAVAQPVDAHYYGAGADLPATKWVVSAGTLPAPTVAAPEVRGWTVSGAGDVTYNGEYYEAGTHNGQTYYTYGTGGATRYLYW